MKAWDMKKIKYEKVRDDFPPPCMAGAHGTAVVRRGEHPARTYGAQSMGTVAPTEVVPRGA